MRWLRFLMFEALGSAMWVAAWMLFGHYVGDHAATLIAFARKFWPAALILAGLAPTGAFVWLYRTRQRRG